MNIFNCDKKFKFTILSVQLCGINYLRRVMQWSLLFLEHFPHLKHELCTLRPPLISISVATTLPFPLRNGSPVVSGSCNFPQSVPVPCTRRPVLAPRSCGQTVLQGTGTPILLSSSSVYGRTGCFHFWLLSIMLLQTLPQEYLSLCFQFFWVYIWENFWVIWWFYV